MSLEEMYEDQTNKKARTKSGVLTKDFEEWQKSDRDPFYYFFQKKAETETEEFRKEYEKTKKEQEQTIRSNRRKKKDESFDLIADLSHPKKVRAFLEGKDNGESGIY